MATAKRKKRKNSRVRARLTPIGAVSIAVLVAGATAFVAGAGTVAAVGGLVALIAVAFAVADQLPAGIGGGWMVGKGRRALGDEQDPAPEYIERAEPATEDAWRKEERRYREKAGEMDD